MVSCNIARLEKVRRAWDFLKQYDIINLQESWVQEKNVRKWKVKFDRIYNWSIKATFRINKKGKAMGGVILGVKKTKNEQVKRVGLRAVVEEIRLEKERKANFVISYNNGKIEEVVKRFEELNDEYRRKGGVSDNCG